MSDPEERHTLILIGASRGIGRITITGLFVFCLFSAISLATSASAQLLPGKIDCKFSENFATYVPTMSADEVTKLKGGAIQICSYSYKEEHDDNFSARLFLPPKLGAGGVCSLPSVDLYLVHDAKGHLVQGEPPKDAPGKLRRDFFNPYMAMATGSQPCPPPGDPRYIDTQNMTEGIFSSLLELWRDVSSQPENLDHYLFNPMIGRPDVFARLREALTNNKSSHAMKLVRLAVGAPEYDGIQRRDDPDYRAGEIVMQVEDNPTHSFLIAVDYTPSGFKIVTIGEVIV